MTRSARICDRSAITSSVSPSLKYSFSGSRLILTNGRTTMDRSRSSGAPDSARDRRAASKLRPSEYLRRGSLDRQRSTIRRSPGGVSGLDLATGRGASFRIRWMTAESASAMKGRSPVSISYRTTPADQTSERWSTGSARVCSGLMYPIVPLRARSPVVPEPPTFATPKSRIFSTPRSVTTRLAGLMSRWTIPASCARDRPAASCVAMSTVSAIDRRPRERALSRGSPS